MGAVRAQSQYEIRPRAAGVRFHIHVGINPQREPRVRRAGLVAAGLLAALGSLAWATSQPGRSAVVPTETYTEVIFEDPIPTGQVKESKEKCTTSCSLAKHPIPDFSPRDFEKALASYAESPAAEASPALETLLFYGARSQEYIEQFGTTGLPAQHLAYLQRELSRDHAEVSLRLVDEAGRVRVSYGPTLVPLGQKQHLSPNTLQAMEFNGTVMRTGVNYLWSRY